LSPVVVDHMPWGMSCEARLSHLGEHTEQEVLVPARALDFWDGCKPCRACAKHIEGELAQDGEVSGPLTFAWSALVDTNERCLGKHMLARLAFDIQGKRLFAKL